MTFTEYVIDALFDPEADQMEWVDVAKKRVEAAIEACWIKIKWPSSEVAVTWGMEAQSNHKIFRKDVQDLVQSAYVLLGIDLFEKLANLALHSLDTREWLSLEATLFCLSALSDSVIDNESTVLILSRLFDSSLFADMTGAGETIPIRTRQTAVNMLSRYAFYFERKPDHLPAMLNFLFESLKLPTLSDVVAKAIFSTCSLCRKDLKSELQVFLRQYEIVLSWESIEAHSKEKLIGAIAAIVETLPTDEEKLAPLTALTNSVEVDASHCIELLNALKGEEAQEKGVYVLKSLLCMSKALQAPDDVVIDLEVDQSRSTFWTEEQGTFLQAKIIQIVGTLTALMKSSSDIIETGCQIFRVGLKESYPNLFVFRLKVILDFILASGTDTARLDYILDTAGILLIGNVKNHGGALNDAASLILYKLLGLIDSMGGQYHRCFFKISSLMEILGNPSNDPEISASLISLATTIFSSYLEVAIAASHIEKLFNFILKALTAPDIMPKRSAIQFWVRTNFPTE